MPNNETQKKPAHQDWHRADVKAALDKAGWSMRQLGIQHGYSEKSSPFGEVFRKPWPKVERIIAEAIGEKPQTIWPSRYNADGTPNRYKGRMPKRPPHIKPLQGSTRIVGCNPQKTPRA